MKKLEIFEPAMCCPTGLCGVGVDPELLRISTVLDTLEKKDIKVERYNLSSAPQAFVTNNTVNQFIKDKGVEGLPVAVLDGEIVITGRYPSNDEFGALLDLSQDVLGEAKVDAEGSDESDGCCCSGGCCC
ncbi:MAG TPA: arsenite efflux transporter metallochaperone ArsD [Mobilitalea sp.]|nr:arsenite efflux transporter metallochaperone ArsD [Mobilitalea sp.]